MIVRPILQAMLPGDDKWLWRRTACLVSVGVLLYCIVVAARERDSAMVAQLGICFLGALGFYTGAGVVDNHLRRNADREDRRVSLQPRGDNPDAT